MVAVKQQSHKKIYAPEGKKSVLTATKNKNQRRK